MLGRKAYKGTLKTNIMKRMMIPFHMRKISPHPKSISSDNITPDKEHMDLDESGDDSTESESGDDDNSAESESGDGDNSTEEVLRLYDIRSLQYRRLCHKSVRICERLSKC